MNYDDIRERVTMAFGALLALLLGGGVASAQADTLMITSGSGILYRLGDSNVGLSGDGWSVSYFAQGGQGGDGGSQGVNLTVGLLGAFGVVHAFSDSCTFDYHNPIDAVADCGSFQFTAPTYPAGVFPSGTVIADIPMTVTGHLNVGPGYDFMGEGTVTGVYGPWANIPEQLHYHVVAVPEPSTLVLVVTGLGVMAWAWRRRQAWRIGALLALLLGGGVASAQADTLMITFGFGAFDVGGETLVGLGGDGWSASYRFLGGSSGDGRSQGGSFADGGFGTFSGIVQAFGEVCTFGQFPGFPYSSANCGFFQFTAPDYPPGPLPPAAGRLAPGGPGSNAETEGTRMSGPVAGLFCAPS